MLYQRIKKEYDRLQLSILQLQERINKLPQGTLIVTRNGKKYYKWYVVDDTGKKFIPQKEHHDECAYQKELELLENPEFQKLIEDIYKPQQF